MFISHNTYNAARVLELPKSMPIAGCSSLCLSSWDAFAGTVRNNIGKIMISKMMKMLRLVELDRFLAILVYNIFGLTGFEKLKWCLY